MLHQLELQINQAHGIDGRFTAFCHGHYGSLEGTRRWTDTPQIIGSDLCQGKVKQRLRPDEVLVKSIFSSVLDI